MREADIRWSLKDSGTGASGGKDSGIEKREM